MSVGMADALRGSALPEGMRRRGLWAYDISSAK
jgi:hypothetical protein